MARINWDQLSRLLEDNLLPIEETTPLDQDATNRVIVDKLNAVLAHMTILSREVARHSRWLGFAAQVVRWGTPFVALMLARVETLPPWLRELIGALVGGSVGQ
jgi:hypothetical protein